jgi:7,8-dihydropterin-6-yl-methyl-4-(beta-D-ribofuranosyl)aminobenzene 5'-phosphate synthase
VLVRGQLTLYILLIILLMLALALFALYHAAETHEKIAVPAASITPTTMIVKGGSVSWAKLIVLVDNNPDPNHKLESAWGVSILIITPKAHILFDTGPSPTVLEYNARRLGVDLCSVDAVVISHEHLDHIGGLPYIAKHCPSKPVYIPHGFSQDMLRWLRGMGLQRIIIVNHTMQIAPGVFILSPLYGPPWEESLVVNVTGFGGVLLVGCSHPGIVNIAKEMVKEGFKPGMVIGGFHMFASPYSECLRVARRLVSMGFKAVAPIHCSGDTIRGILKQIAPDHYLPAHAGSVILVNANGVYLLKGSMSVP